MPIYQAVVLAIVQALTEFLPISSTAHLVLIPWLFGWKDAGLTFDVALHAGTLVAVVIYFFRDWVQIIGQAFGLNTGVDPDLRQNRNLLWLLAVASIPIGIVGYLFDKQADTTWRQPYVIGTMMILVGIVLWMAEKRRVGSKSMSTIQFSDGIAVGLAQAVSVIPGTSRSGATISAGLFRNMNRETAARFSFLLSTPAIAAAVAKKAWDIHKEGGIPPDMKVPIVVGIIVSGVLGAIVIAFFLRYLRRSSLMPFVYYRIVFGIIVIALAAFFRFSAG
ncbi:MAG TPA: undecaprenyl-diphosphatase UppP [Bryobacteraceae bacterium]|jgi:undecaprenyl-diphosphatase|nr:undecaprenyl-diphosphatase UppP [Bryobacteraceae bacterium]